MPHTVQDGYSGESEAYEEQAFAVKHRLYIPGSKSWRNHYVSRFSTSTSLGQWSLPRHFFPVSLIEAGESLGGGTGSRGI